MTVTATWTFSLKGTCVYCQKTVTRTRSVQADTSEEAVAKADSIVANGLWHKKCGLS